MRISNKTIEGEVQVTSSDNRIRRLIPYSSYYYPQPQQEYSNFPLEYLPFVSQFFAVFCGNEFGIFICFNFEATSIILYSF
jgi:hypothetical protein